MEISKSQKIEKLEKDLKKLIKINEIRQKSLKVLVNIDKKVGDAKEKKFKEDLERVRNNA